MKRKVGFTLIELLVVIAVIALLMSILMPALSRARLQAQKIWCLANLKGAMLAALVYGENYDGCLANSGRAWPYMTMLDFQELLVAGEYLDGDGLHCPADKRTDAPGVVAAWWKTNRGATMTRTDHMFEGTFPKELDGEVEYSYVLSSKMYMNGNADITRSFSLLKDWRLSQVKHPDRLIAFWHFWENITGNEEKMPPHGTLAWMSSFPDGHSAPVVFDDILPRDWDRNGEPDEYSDATELNERINCDWTCRGIKGTDIE